MVYATAYNHAAGRPLGTTRIYIDNSNLWIQGQRTYAEKKGLDVSWDPTWRFDVGGLKDILLTNSGLKADEKTFEVKFTLYGSTPPPVDTVWKAIESHDVKVNTFQRSSWTKREKQVDAELIVDSVEEACEAFHCQLPTVFIIVSGDRDVLSAVARITKKYQCQVHLWSWENGLARAYTQREDDTVDWDLVKVHLLDNYLEQVGFHATTFRIDRNVISPHSIVVLDPLSKPDKVEKFLSSLKTPVYRYENEEKRPESSSKDLTLIPAFVWSMKPDELTSLFMECKTKLEASGLTVMTYAEYSQRYLGGIAGETSLVISNRFGELPPDKGDSDDNETDEDEEENDANGNDGFTEVNHRQEKQRETLKKNEQNAARRCYWRMYCSKGASCKYAHSKDELKYFSAYLRGKRATKYKLCQNEECTWGSRCYSAHGMEELFCPTCEKTGVHEMRDCPDKYPSTHTHTYRI